jgi:hypothetical protein
MIAPLRDPRSPCDPPANSLAVARRAVAAMLFQRARSQISRPARVSAWNSWAMVVWIVLVAASYFVLVGWWAVERY